MNTVKTIIKQCKIKKSYHFVPLPLYGVFLDSWGPLKQHTLCSKETVKETFGKPGSYFWIFMNNIKDLKDRYSQVFSPLIGDNICVMSADFMSILVLPLSPLRDNEVITGWRSRQVWTKGLDLELSEIVRTKGLMVLVDLSEYFLPPQYDIPEDFLI